jgi:hypothetical protein
MDPITALGLAAAVVQFVDFATKLTNGTRQVYVSGSGATAGNADLELCASELEKLCVRLTPEPSPVRSEEDEALC